MKAAGAIAMVLLGSECSNAEHAELDAPSVNALVPPNYKF
jgi:hypothetical protein